jgi:hypothetical protein
MMLESKALQVVQLAKIKTYATELFEASRDTAVAPAATATGS